MGRSGFAILVCFFLTIPIVAAQLKVDVALVNIVATVIDDRGQYIADLNANDFVVEEDGKPQTISHFTQSNDLPVSMGVLLDTSGSMERKIGTATKAVERFIRSVHSEDDIFLMTFATRPVVQQDFTDDRDRLARALRRVAVGGGTALYDALEMGLSKIKQGVQDKKAILLITDGEDTSSEATLEDAETAVRESELLVYCLGISPTRAPLSERGPTRTDPTGRRTPGIGFPFPIPIPGIPGGGTGIPGRPAFPSPQNPRNRTRVQTDDTVDMTVLESFANASGGKAWLLSGSWTDNGGVEIQDALDEIASELRNQYSIGYYPSHDLKDGKWHRIDVKTRNNRYHVRARKQYFGG